MRERVADKLATDELCIRIVHTRFLLLSLLGGSVLRRLAALQCLLHVGIGIGITLMCRSKVGTTDEALGRRREGCNKIFYHLRIGGNTR